VTDHLNKKLQIIYLARHGETAWSLTGQHTGLTDLPLTENGESNARRLGDRLRGLTFAQVWSSPLRRATRTCELAGFAAAAEIDPRLGEWQGRCGQKLRFRSVRDGGHHRADEP
jgi:probable phosphoglycerate mutase